MLIPTKKNIHLRNSMAGVEPKKGKVEPGPKLTNGGSTTLEKVLRRWR